MIRTKTIIFSCKSWQNDNVHLYQVLKRDKVTFLVQMSRCNTFKTFATSLAYDNSSSYNRMELRRSWQPLQYISDNYLFIGNFNVQLKSEDKYTTGPVKIWTHRGQRLGGRKSRSVGWFVNISKTINYILVLLFAPRCWCPAREKILTFPQLLDGS